MTVVFYGVYNVKFVNIIQSESVRYDDERKKKEQPE